MRPAEVCGCWTYPSSSSRARMLRTVADDTPSPAAVTSIDEATGSPDVMYSRTSAASTRRERSGASISTLVLRLLSPLYTARPLSQIATRNASSDRDFGAIDADGHEVVDENFA